MTEKAPDAYRMISEVADALDIPAHVLRFWETKFPHIKPLKRGGGRRYYRRGDVDLLRTISQLLYQDGYTIRGVQRLLKTHGLNAVLALRTSAPVPDIDESGSSTEDFEALTTAQLLEELSGEIEACRKRLAGVMHKAAA